MDKYMTIGERKHSGMWEAARDHRHPRGAHSVLPVELNRSPDGVGKVLNLVEKGA